MSIKKYSLALVIILAVILAACSPSTESPELSQPISLKLGVLPYLSHAPLYIAQEEGFFSDQGLDVELIPFNQTGEMIAPLLQGDLDIVVGAVTPSILNAITQGGNIKFTANKGFLNPDQGCTVTAWMARNELLESGNLDDPENLKGLKIANAPGTIFDYALELYLNQQGLTKEDVELLSNPPTPTLMESLGSGAIDIGGLSEPWVTRAIDAGYAGILFRGDEILPYYDLGLIVYGPSLLENVDAGRRFMVAYLKAVNFYGEGKTERNIELVAEYTQLSPEEVEKTCWQVIKPDGQINIDLILEYQEWALENGFIDSIVSAEQFWDPQYIDYAHQVLK